jgi:predicted phage baseplate assembly protein
MNCGCCSCLAAANTVSVAPNRPGLSAISRRIGTHGTFYQRMIARLSALDPVTGRLGALGGLTTRETSDPSIAFLDAWAACGDVLTFYQERFANEGYLRTATERRSILELGRLIGYTLQPGVSATSYAAYIMDEKAATTIPAGAKMQSTPLLPGEEPQIFETAEDLEARGEWNYLKVRMTRPATVTSQALMTIGFRLYLEGSEHNLSSGDPLLFEFAPTEFAVAWIRDVEVDRTSKRTAVTFHRVALGTRNDPAVSAPDSNVTTVLTSQFSEELNLRKESLFDDASVPPANRFDLPASYEDRFKDNSDFRLQAVGELVPQLKKVPVVLANLPRQKDDRLIGVWVMRNRSAVFGYNAPDQIATLSGQINDADATFAAPKPDAKTEKENRVYLELPDDAIAAGSWIVVLKGNKVLVRNVRDVLSLPRARYGISGKTTRLDLDVPWWTVTEFDDIRTTSVLARAEPLTVAWEPVTDPVGMTIVDKVTPGNTGETPSAPTTKITKVATKGKTIALDALATGLTPGRWIIVAGTRADLPGVQSAELAMIAEVEHSGVGSEEGEIYSRIIIAGEGLAYSYARDSVKIYGNVVKITNGESFTEILGNGDATQRLQSFTLRHAPLTWVAAANPAGVVTTLQVRVHDVLVREVSSLAAAGPADRVYVTKTADSGKTTITFGSGERGARLPTGTDNVRAIYRKGLGRAANVKAGQIDVALTRVAGTREVINPIEASGGADPEPANQARANLPLAVRALGRVVSVRDYEEFARTFAGIAKALATIAPTRRDLVLLTIAGAGEMEILETSDLYRSLVEALRKYGNPLQPLNVINRRKILMTGSARVQVLREYEWKNVAPRIRASLLDTFSFERRALMQPIFPSEVVAAIQRVEGVAWVDLDTLRGFEPEEFFEGGAFAPALEAIVPPKVKFDSAKRRWLGAGVAYLPSSLADAFVLQEVPNV